MTTDLLKLAHEALEDDKHATAGPWRWWTSNSFVRLSSDATGKDGDVMSGETQSDGQTSVRVGLEDMKVIAAARTREPLLAQGYLDLVRVIDAERATDLDKLARAALPDTDHNGREWKIARGYLDARAEVARLIAEVRAVTAGMEHSPWCDTMRDLSKLSGCDCWLGRIRTITAKGGKTP
jgi:hypothetical protein